MEEMDIEYNLTTESSKSNVIMDQLNSSFQEESVLTAKCDDPEATTRIFRAKQYETVKHQVKISFEITKCSNLQEEKQQELEFAIVKLEELTEQNKIAQEQIAEQNEVLKRAKTQLETREFISKKIVATQIEKQAITVRNMANDYSKTEAAALEKVNLLNNWKQKVLGLNEIKKQYISDISSLTKMTNQSKIKEMESTLNIKSQELTKLRSTVNLLTSEQNLTRNNLIKEKMVNSGLNQRQVKLLQEILETKASQEEKVNNLQKVLLEKQEEYLNIKYGLLTRQAKKVEYENILQKSAIHLNDLKEKLEQIKADMKREFQNNNELNLNNKQLESQLMKQKEERDNEKEVLDKSTNEINCKIELLQTSRAELEKEIQDYSVKATNLFTINGELISSIKKQEFEFLKRKDKDDKLQQAIDSLKNELIESTNNVCSFENEKVDITNNIAKLQDEIKIVVDELSEKQGIYPNEVAQVQTVQDKILEKMVTLESVTRKNQMNIQTIEKNNDLRDSYQRKVNFLDLEIKAVKAGILIKPGASTKTISRAKENIQPNLRPIVTSPKNESGILKKPFGLKSPKHVRFESVLSGQTTEESDNDSFLARMFREPDRDDVANSPAVRQPAFKKRRRFFPG